VTARPELTDLLAGARVVSLPLRTRFRGVSKREALLFEGENGWAEWSPFLEYEDEEAAIWLRAAIEFASGDLPALQRTEIGINATLPAVGVDEVEKALRPFGKFSTVKIKVAEPGQTLHDDLNRIIKVWQTYPGTKIRLDANGGLEADEAITLVGLMQENGIALEYFEQPCQTIAELAEFKQKLRRHSDSVLVAADESVRKVSDPLAVALAGAADILVLKAAPLGGIRKTLDISAEAGLPVVISSALETSIGISMGLHLAGALPELTYDCGLGTAAMFIGDITKEPLVAENGILEIRRVEPSESKLQTFAAEDHRADWWIERLERCYRLI
jgi:O-succinylbenzoate synthase